MYFSVEKRKLTCLFTRRCGTITYLYDETYLRDCNFLSLSGVAPPIVEPYIYLTSGLIVYRKGERDGMYNIDKSVDGGINWELAIVQIELDEDSIVMSIDDGVAGYRHLVRDEAYVIDEELYSGGFSDAEGVGWQNIYNTNTL
jgi:hypothetical protein